MSKLGYEYANIVYKLNYKLFIALYYFIVNTLVFFNHISVLYSIIYNFGVKKVESHWSKYDRPNLKSFIGWQQASYY